jgi:hypothetical protein
VRGEVIPEAEVNSDIKTSSLNQQHPADNYKYSTISFLEIVIHHVEHTLSVTIHVKPGQIVAGLEVEKTRQFL